MRIYVDNSDFATYLRRNGEKDVHVVYYLNKACYIEVLNCDNVGYQEIKDGNKIVAKGHRWNTNTTSVTATLYGDSGKLYYTSSKSNSNAWYYPGTGSKIYASNTTLFKNGGTTTKSTQYTYYYYKKNDGKETVYKLTSSVDKKTVKETGKFTFNKSKTDLKDSYDGFKRLEEMSDLASKSYNTSSSGIEADIKASGSSGKSTSTNSSSNSGGGGGGSASTLPPTPTWTDLKEVATCDVDAMKDFISMVQEEADSSNWTDEKMSLYNKTWMDTSKVITLLTLNWTAKNKYVAKDNPSGSKTYKKDKLTEVDIYKDISSWTKSSIYATDGRKASSPSAAAKYTTVYKFLNATAGTYAKYIAQAETVSGKTGYDVAAIKAILGDNADTNNDVAAELICLAAGVVYTDKYDELKAGSKTEAALELRNTITQNIETNLNFHESGSTNYYVTNKAGNKVQCSNSASVISTAKMLFNDNNLDVGYTKLINEGVRWYDTTKTTSGDLLKDMDADVENVVLDSECTITYSNTDGVFKYQVKGLQLFYTLYKQSHGAEPTSELKTKIIDENFEHIFNRVKLYKESLPGSSAGSECQSANTSKMVYVDKKGNQIMGEYDKNGVCVKTAKQVAIEYWGNDLNEANNHMKAIDVSVVTTTLNINYVYLLRMPIPSVNISESIHNASLLEKVEDCKATDYTELSKEFIKYKSLKSLQIADSYLIKKLKEKFGITSSGTTSSSSNALSASYDESLITARTMMVYGSKTTKKSSSTTTKKVSHDYLADYFYYQLWPVDLDLKYFYICPSSDKDFSKDGNVLAYNQFHPSGSTVSDELISSIIKGKSTGTEETQVANTKTVSCTIYHIYVAYHKLTEADYKKLSIEDRKTKVITKLLFNPKTFVTEANRFSAAHAKLALSDTVENSFTDYSEALKQRDAWVSKYNILKSIKVIDLDSEKEEIITTDGVLVKKDQPYLWVDPSGEAGTKTVSATLTDANGNQIAVESSSNLTDMWAATYTYTDPKTGDSYSVTDVLDKMAALGINTCICDDPNNPGKKMVCVKDTSYTELKRTIGFNTSTQAISTSGTRVDIQDTKTGEWTTILPEVIVSGDSCIFDSAKYYLELVTVNGLQIWEKGSEYYNYSVWANLGDNGKGVDEYFYCNYINPNPPSEFKGYTKNKPLECWWKINHENGGTKSVNRDDATTALNYANAYQSYSDKIAELETISNSVMAELKKLTEVDSILDKIDINSKTASGMSAVNLKAETLPDGTIKYTASNSKGESVELTKDQYDLINQYKATGTEAMEKLLQAQYDDATVKMNTYYAEQRKIEQSFENAGYSEEFGKLTQKGGTAAVVAKANGALDALNNNPNNVHGIDGDDEAQANVRAALEADLKNVDSIQNQIAEMYATGYAKEFIQQAITEKLAAQNNMTVAEYVAKYGWYNIDNTTAAPVLASDYKEVLKERLSYDSDTAYYDAKYKDLVDNFNKLSNEWADKYPLSTEALSKLTPEQKRDYEQYLSYRKLLKELGVTDEELNGGLDPKEIERLKKKAADEYSDAKNAYNDPFMGNRLAAHGIFNDDGTLKEVTANQTTFGTKWSSEKYGDNYLNPNTDDLEGDLLEYEVKQNESVGDDSIAKAAVNGMGEGPSMSMLLNFTVPRWGVTDFMNDRINWSKRLYSITDEPGWFYFKIMFHFQTSYGLFGSILTDTDGKTFVAGNSAIKYLLSSRNLYKMEKLEDRALALYKFVTTLSFINSNAPWFFRSVKGLNSAGVMDLNDFSKDKYIEIGLDKDAVDMRLTTLVELYRFICFDYINCKEILPENLRKFDMSVLVFQAPIRNFQTGVRISNTYYKPKSMSDSDFSNRMSFKMFTFKNCEFLMDELANVIPSEMKNELPFNLGESSLKIKYDRCYHHLMNEWTQTLFGTDGYYFNENGVYSVANTSSSRKDSIGRLNSKGSSNEHNKRLAALKNALQSTSYNPSQDQYKAVVDATEYFLRDILRNADPTDILGNFYEDQRFVNMAKIRNAVYEKQIEGGQLTGRRDGNSDSELVTNASLMMDEMLEKYKTADTGGSVSFGNSSNTYTAYDIPTLYKTIAVKQGKTFRDKTWINLYSDSDITPLATGDTSRFTDGWINPVNNEEYTSFTLSDYWKDKLKLWKGWGYSGDDNLKFSDSGYGNTNLYYSSSSPMNPFRNGVLDSAHNYLFDTSLILSQSVSDYYISKINALLHPRKGTEGFSSMHAKNINLYGFDFNPYRGDIYWADGWEDMEESTYYRNKIANILNPSNELNEEPLNIYGFDYGVERTNREYTKNFLQPSYNDGYYSRSASEYYESKIAKLLNPGGVNGVRARNLYGLDYGVDRYNLEYDKGITVPYIQRVSSDYYNDKISYLLNPHNRLGNDPVNLYGLDYGVDRYDNDISMGLTEGYQERTASLYYYAKLKKNLWPAAFEGIDYTIDIFDLEDPFGMPLNDIDLSQYSFDEDPISLPLNDQSIPSYDTPEYFASIYEKKYKAGDMGYEPDITGTEIKSTFSDNSNILESWLSTYVQHQLNKSLWNGDDKPVIWDNLDKKENEYYQYNYGWKNNNSTASDSNTTDISDSGETTSTSDQSTDSTTDTTAASTGSKTKNKFKSKLKSAISSATSTLKNTDYSNLESNVKTKLTSSFSKLFK